MYKLNVDVEKNRLYIIVGNIEKGEAPEIYNDLVEMVKKLQKDFTAISDISDFAPQEPSETFYADKILKLLADTGMKKVIRVTGKPTERRVETVTEYGYLVGLAETVEDAEKYLDEE